MFTPVIAQLATYLVPIVGGWLKTLLTKKHHANVNTALKAGLITQDEADTLKSAFVPQIDISVPEIKK